MLCYFILNYDNQLDRWTKLKVKTEANLMEELRRLEKFQSVVSAITCHGLLSSSTSDSASSRFLSSLVLFLVMIKFSVFEFLTLTLCKFPGENNLNFILLSS